MENPFYRCFRYRIDFNRYSSTGFWTVSPDRRVYAYTCRHCPHFPSRLFSRHAFSSGNTRHRETTHRCYCLGMGHERTFYRNRWYHKCFTVHFLRFQNHPAGCSAHLLPGIFSVWKNEENRCTVIIQSLWTQDLEQAAKVLWRRFILWPGW